MLHVTLLEMLVFELLLQVSIFYVIDMCTAHFVPVEENVHFSPSLFPSLSPIHIF